MNNVGSIKSIILDKNTSVAVPEPMTKPVGYAVDMLLRDMEKVFGKRPEVADKEAASIIVEYASENDVIYNRKEAFAIRFDEAGSRAGAMHICGSDDLGIIYGILHISKEYLGVDPFWFWTDRKPQRKTEAEIPAMEYISPEYRVRYRGWFVNDEVCLIGWTDIYPPPKEVWYRVFEALLRCGGNMVIPGTDLPRSGIHHRLAEEMGLYITHHHAEPLSAEMFFRVYPDREASYDKNAELFEGLWRDSIEAHKDEKTVWILGFRGQGDCPFWEQDTACSTPESRGALISKVIRRQYEILEEYIKNPVCATYLYGEITELYRQGLINMPDHIIKIWADNGYGKMVSRRQGNHNPRVPSLPMPEDAGMHGLYYHITFHDLQASNHLTMFPSDPVMVKDELMNAFNAGADSFLLLNSGNIRPHVYLLDIVAELWRMGNIDIGSHLESFCRRFFESEYEKVAECYRKYFRKTIRYGTYEDDRAGEEFYHHPARAVMKHWIRGEISGTAEDLIWATGNKPFSEQVCHFFKLTGSALEGWEELKKECMHAADLMKEDEAVFFRDNILFQVKLHLSGCKGFNSLCKGYFAFREGNYPLSFIYVTQSIREYNKGLEAMTLAEHDIWRNFYRADWLTNIKSTIYSLDAVRKYLRMLGDSPDFFLWYKQYIMPENEKKIYLENTHRKPLSDDELADRLEEKLIHEDQG